MFLGPFDQGGDFRDSGIKGITRFLERVWQLSTKSQITNPKQIPNSNFQITKKIHQTIKKVTEDIENLRYNTAISAMMILLNDMEPEENIGKENLEIFVKLLAPFAPHLSEEICQIAERRGTERGTTRKFRSIHLEPWPKYDPALIKEDEAEIVVQINGKIRAVIKIRSESGQAEVEKIAKESEAVKKYLTGEIRKVIFVKDKLINFVI